MPLFRGRLCLIIGPALLLGVAYEVFLGHRHDYTGHYAAGYGASLAATMLLFKTLPSDQFQRHGMRAILPATTIYILMGVVTELTIFNVAKFDEIDFFNQSLGAVLAGAAAISFCGTKKPPDRLLRGARLSASCSFFSAAFCQLPN